MTRKFSIFDLHNCLSFTTHFLYSKTSFLCMCTQNVYPYSQFEGETISLHFLNEEEKQLS